MTTRNRSGVPGYGGNDEDNYRRGDYRGSSAFQHRGYRGLSYIPDNDENRSYEDRDYENRTYGASGSYGYQPREDEMNPGGYGGASTRGGWGFSPRYERYDGFHHSRSNIGAWSSDYGGNDFEPGMGRGNRDYDYRGEFGVSYDPDLYRAGNDYHDRIPGGENAGRRRWDHVNSGFSDQDERREQVRRRMGMFGGRGPGNYHRSENRIREDVCDRLTDDDYIDASEVQVLAENDTVILSGVVHSREEKRRAENLVERISGVRNVENRLHVHPAGMAAHDYTGNTDLPGGIGRESGTTNEIIRNNRKE